ncbi:thiol-disulfide oxidoreductase DCC family protein [Pseudalkalibacillus sp. A8]|uniref:thiol-disulfide oxidoreductase DCC family protein n=1 Tax=Pseudalkalibacillus sp. A8 TaxID=3382641 RepID=UPI0038B42057
MKHVVFYDAECPLCSKARIVIERLDWFQRIYWIPIQQIEKTEYKAFITQNRKVYDEIHMITSKGKVLTGFNTVRRIFLLLPVSFPISLILYLPFIEKVFSPIYMWVSKNRFRWFGRYETTKVQ